jgi:hypothetical protein
MVDFERLAVGDLVSYAFPLLEHYPTNDRFQNLIGTTTEITKLMYHEGDWYAQVESYPNWWFNEEEFNYFQPLNKGSMVGYYIERS